MQDQYTLKLYVAGHTARSERAIHTLQEICESELESRYQLTVVDVLERPEEAEAANVIATPTLIKELPDPLRRIIGDLSDRERVLVGIDLVAH